MNNQAQHFPGLEIKPVTKHYIDCPVCSNVRAFQVDHLCIGHHDVHGQTCDSCDTHFRFTYENGKINLVTALKKSIPVLALLKYVGNSVNEKLFFVIETSSYLEDPANRDRDKEFESLRYWIDEHTCPTNLIPVECIIHNGDDDHHGVVELVDYVSIEELCKMYGVTKKELLDSNNNHYQHYFAKHTGMNVIHEIDYNRVYEGTAQTPPTLQLPYSKMSVNLRVPTGDPETLSTIERWVSEMCAPDAGQISTSFDAWLKQTSLPTVPEDAMRRLGDFLDHLAAEGYSVDKSQFTDEQLDLMIWPKSIQQQDSPIKDMTEFSVNFSSVRLGAEDAKESRAGEETDPKSI